MSQQADNTLNEVSQSNRMKVKSIRHSERIEKAGSDPA